MSEIASQSQSNYSGDRASPLSIFGSAGTMISYRSRRGGGRLLAKLERDRLLDNSFDGHDIRYDCYTASDYLNVTDMFSFMVSIVLALSAACVGDI